MSVRQYLKDNILVCDGAFGTYYSASGGKCDVAEQANFSEPEKVVEIHRSRCRDDKNQHICIK